MVNSIHSCNDLKELHSANMQVKLIRGTSQSVLPESGYLNAIESFEIRDNGIGSMKPTMTPSKQQTLGTDPNSAERASVGFYGS